MTRHSLRMHSISGLRASLIRANPCSFSDRYVVTSGSPVGQGSFGQVHCCVDKLAKTSRAVKRLPMPADERKQAVLRGEVAALVALDHPHIVRLIEYFVESDEVLLVMELLEGPSLGERMQEVGRFDEEAAAQCLRHMLKALFCCHCQGFAHNDVSRENFKFLTPHPRSSLKMLDFGLSGHCREGSAFPVEAEHGRFAQECDVWRAGVIAFVMLSGAELFPMCSSSQPSEHRPACACDPELVPARLRDLDASPEALDVLQGLLEPSSHSLTAREALMHPFITRFYPPVGSEQSVQDWGGSAYSLRKFVSALRSFHDAARLKRLALLIAAHLLTNNCETTASIHRLFRCLARDDSRVEEPALRAAMATLGLDVPEDLALTFSSADVSGKRGLDYIEFVAVAVVAEPKLYCRELMLRTVFRFFDAADIGLIDDGVVRSLFDLPMCGGGDLVGEACDCPQMSFTAFCKVMVPEGWAEGPTGGKPAPWAYQPDVLAGPEDAALELPGEEEGPCCTATPKRRKNPVTSLPSAAFDVQQKPGFYRRALQPFYEAQPVSNVVLGIIRGTSRYARGAARRGLAEILRLEDGARGAFFIMPNPKYHWSPGDVELVDAPRLRLVAWWIHPDFLDELVAWFEDCVGGPCSPVLRPQPPPGQPGLELGAPGDFGFSEVAKPAGYLHTYRDLAGQADVKLLEALVAGVGATLERLIGDALPLARVSVGFHYPVRPQYSTLHLQIRVNAGEVCDAKENRGIDLFQLSAQLRADPECLRRDDEVMQYKATSNLRVALLAAAAEAGGQGREVGPQELVLV